MFQRFLMVCVGNICRSPMAAAVLEARLGELGHEGRVESAGIAALVGSPASPLARELMRERGLDISAHRARQLTREMLGEFDLVLVMEDAHRRVVEQMHPPARGRVQRLGRFGDFDVPDPYGGPRAEYERALGLIDRGIAEYEGKLWGAST
jgi:protein-tyrosine phosphatase